MHGEDSYKFDSMPETAEDALKRWDAGMLVWTMEMGGLGPGYEQCIHILVFEIIRDSSGQSLMQLFGPEWGKQAADRVSAKLGLSGGQVNAAKSLASLVLINGWKKTLEQNSDRGIQVSKNFPRWEESDAK